MAKKRRSRRKKTQLGGTRELRGVLGPAYPDYGPVEQPFHTRFNQLPNQSVGKPFPHRRPFKLKRRQRGGGGTNAVVTIKGRPVYLMTRGKKVAATTL